MFDDLDGLSDASGVPCVDGCDELGCLPVDLVVLDVRVLDDGGLLKISSAAVCSVFLQSGGEVAFSFPDVHLSALTGNPVDSHSVVRVRFVLVGLYKSLEFAGG